MAATAATGSEYRTLNTFAFIKCGQTKPALCVCVCLHPIYPWRPYERQTIKRQWNIVWHCCGFALIVWIVPYQWHKSSLRTPTDILWFARRRSQATRNYSSSFVLRISRTHSALFIHMPIYLTNKLFANTQIFFRSYALQWMLYRLACLHWTPFLPTRYILYVIYILSYFLATASPMVQGCIRHKMCYKFQVSRCDTFFVLTHGCARAELSES